MKLVFSDWHFVIMVCIAIFLSAGIDQKTKNALKVQHTLKKIEKHHQRSGQKAQTAVVSQTELNDYIEFRLAREKDIAISDIDVTLLDRNHVGGIARLDSKSMGLELLFGDKLIIDFKGLVESRMGSARMNWHKVRLNGQSVNPEMLDKLIQTAAHYNGTRARSIRDWYEMPKGIKRVVVQNRRATLHY